MFHMFSFFVTSNQDVVEADEYKIQPSTKIVHKALEIVWRYDHKPWSDYDDMTTKCRVWAFGRS